MSSVIFRRKAMIYLIASVARRQHNSVLRGSVVSPDRSLVERILGRRKASTTTFDRAIRLGNVSTRKNVNFQVDNTDKIMNLCDMFEKGLLNESQFERAKEQLLG
jgi:hypothetical protein